VSEPGEYRVGIRFNEEEIPDSPFKVYISPDTGEAKKVDIGQFPDGLVQTNKPSMILVRKNGAKGQLDAKLV
jgi:filamin